MSTTRTKFTPSAARARVGRSVYAKVAVDVFRAYANRGEQPVEVWFRRIGTRVVPYVRFPRWTKAVGT